MNKLTALYIVVFANAFSFAPSFVMAAENTAHGHTEAAKGGLPQFDPTWFASQIFWLAISFAILYMVFAKKTLPDISSVIENRKNHIQSDLETAETLTAEADSVQSAYQDNLKKAQSNAADAIKTVEDKAKKDADVMMDKFRQKSEADLSQAEERIEESKSAAMNDMNKIAAQAAAQAVEKIIGVKTDDAKIKTIIKSMNSKTTQNKSKAA